MRFEFIHVEKAMYPVTVLCQVLGVSRSGYYGWTKRGPSTRQRREDGLALKVEAVHRDSRDTYGSPRVCAKLRQKGEVVSPRTVAKVMRNNGLAGRRKKKFRANGVSLRQPGGCEPAS